MDDQTLKRRALREVGDTGMCCQWEVTLPQSTQSGVWSLSFCGVQTSALSALTGRAAVQSALEALTIIKAGNVEVMGVPLGPFRIRFVGELGGQKLPFDQYPLSGSGAALVPAAQLQAIQTEMGDDPVMTSIATELLANIGFANKPDARLSKLKLGLFDTLLGQSHKGVDVQTAQRLEKLAQQHSNLLQLRSNCEGELNAALGLSDTGVPGGAPVATKIRKTTPNGLPYGVLPTRGGSRFNGR